MLLNLNSRRSGIQTDLCPFIKVRRSMCPLLPWPSIRIHLEMSDTGRAICAPPPPSQKLGGARVPSFRGSSLACYKFREVWHRPGHLCPPPPHKLWEGHVLPSPFPLLIHSEMFHRLGHLCPLLKSSEGHVSSPFADQMPDTSRYAHFTPLINWLINASREGSRRPGALGGVNRGTR